MSTTRLSTDLMRSLVVLAALVARLVLAPDAEASSHLSLDEDERVRAVLAGKHLSEQLRDGEMIGPRGAAIDPRVLRVMKAVPIVMDREGLASGYVAMKDNARVLIVTNDHAVSKPFGSDGQRTAIVVFFDAELMRSQFDGSRVDKCRIGTTAWCTAYYRSVRRARILATDTRRDLALLQVDDAPSDVERLPSAREDQIQPNLDLAVVGHPDAFAWSWSSGKVSAYRQEFSWRGQAIKAIQTHAPIHHGNSGGPLLTIDSNVLGIVVGGPLETLNFAVAVPEIDSFVQRVRASQLQR